MSSPSDDPRSAYIHGSAPEEQGRLSRLNDLMNRATLREMALRGGERILDVGSGLGQLARAMAVAAGKDGRVIAFERDEQQFEEAIRLARSGGEEGSVDWRRGDALAPPLSDGEWGTFDVAHTRFLLEHVRDPLSVVRAMVRAVRPSGRIVLADDDHDVLRLWPEPVGFSALWAAYMRTYDRLGNDPYVGRRLVSLLHQAGASPVRNTWIFFGGCSGDPDFLPLVDNLAGILAGARAAILSQDLLGAEEVDAALDALMSWGARPDAALWFAICWAEGVRPPRPIA